MQTTSRIVRSAIAWLLLVVAAGPAGAAGSRHAVASAHPLATEAGEAVLAAGGNAFDAAVAVAATLAVVEPFASGFGGGGFFLLHRARDGSDVVVDAREIAPAAVSPALYTGADGKPDPRASLDGPRAAAIPGLAAGVAHLQREFGTMPLAELLAPAIRHAEEGFAADARFAAAAGWRQAVMAADAAASAAFLDSGKAPAAGFVVRQPALGRTLRAIARDGADAFYRGPIAAEMVRAVRARGGVWSEADLAGYRVAERHPARIEYRGAHITTVPLPSSGGIVLAEALHILEQFDYDGADAATRAHLVVEALRRAFQDRSRFLGDADLVDVPADRLRSQAYGRERAAGIDPLHATPSATLAPADPPRSGNHTTHFSIVDADGNRVAATLSVNGPFGAGMVAGESGVLLNNEMDDFAIAPGGNLYGLTGGAANAPAPGKRPLSSMSPTFVEDSRGVLVLGTPGGSRILSMVLLGILEHLHGERPDVARVVALPRFHHQYLPDRVEVEPGQFAAAWKAALQALGHEVQEGRRRWGNMQAIFVDGASGEATAAGDPRGRSGVLF